MINDIDIINSVLLEAKSLEDFKNVPIDAIIRIHITILNKRNDWLGKIVPILYEGKLAFEIFIHQSVIDDLQSDENDKIGYARAVILHELYHLKEMSMTNNIIDVTLVHNIKRDCTFNLLNSLGYLEWGEYYAHFNSTKHYKGHNNMSDSIYQSEISLSVLSSKLDEENDVMMPEFMYDNIHSFISKSVIFAARYNCSQDESYIKNLRRYKNSNLYKAHYNYISDLIVYMDSLYQTYPNWISKSIFLDIGRRLFSIIHYYNITFSSDNLLDSFVFVKLK